MSSSQKYERCSDWKRFRTSPPSRSSSSGCALRCSTYCCTERLGCLFEGGEGKENESDTWIAIDGTGHPSQYASVYYTQRSAPHRKQRKRYTRNQIAVETGGQAIIVHQVASGPRHEARDALPLIRRTEAVHPVGYSMDKAYDSEEIRRVVVEERRWEQRV